MAFTFGGGTTQTKGFSFPTPSTTTTTTAQTSASTGFTFGGTTLNASSAATTQPATSASTFAFSLGGTATTAATATTTSAPSFGFGLGGSATTSTTSTAGSSSFGKSVSFGAATGLSLAGLGTSTATTTGSSGFTFGATPTTTTTSTGLSLGPVFASTSQPSSKGLGGVDSQTKSASIGESTSNGKSSDSKAIKETNVPNQIAATVENFKKYVKEQKNVREDIARLSSKPILKVQEDAQALRQMLSVVSNGLQRNAGAIEKLKAETSQELKNVEIAQRTKDTPPGLQYENTAPAEYFQQLVEDFESRMLMYRQQIESVESHFALMNQPGIVSLSDITMLLRKLHETFIAFAAQLQAVHEAIKVQKDHYLSYRKVFLGDSTNIFEAKHKTLQKISEKPSARVGPTPFSGMTNAAAVAMATALNRGQQPSAAPPAVGLNTMLGQTTQASTLGAGLGLGSTATSAGFSFGTPATQASGFGFGSPAQPAFTSSSSFQLQKPPAGSKRGKKN